jgi:two-component system, chemotaxis family, response regulator Rcp1
MFDNIHRLINVLLVEDSDSDYYLVKHAFDDRVNLFRVADGEEATLFVSKQPPYQFAPVPDLILLDLNLPRKDGRSFLKELRLNPSFSNLIVVILTTSKDPIDVHELYSLGANAYVTKPVDIDDLFRVLQSLEDFWFRTARLPNLC